MFLYAAFLGAVGAFSMVAAKRWPSLGELINELLHVKNPGVLTCIASGAVGAAFVDWAINASTPPDL